MAAGDIQLWLHKLAKHIANDFRKLIFLDIPYRFYRSYLNVHKLTDNHL